MVVIDPALFTIVLALHRNNSAYSECHDPGPRSPYHKELTPYASSAKRAGCRVHATPLYNLTSVTTLQQRVLHIAVEIATFAILLV